MKRAEKRDHLIDIAIRLFSRRGFHATGVDQIIEETGIAKTTLYRHFASKEELIVAALAKADEAARDEMRSYVEQQSDPRERLLATFGQLDIWLKDCDFNGCPFVAAAGEFGDASNAVFQQAKMHKRLYLAYFEELVRAARVPSPKRIAAQIVLLHEGAIAFAQVLGSEGVADTARIAAERLIDAEMAAAARAK